MGQSHIRKDTQYLLPTPWLRYYITYWCIYASQGCNRRRKTKSLARSKCPNGISPGNEKVSIRGLQQYHRKRGLTRTIRISGPNTPNPQILPKTQIYMEKWNRWSR